MSGKKVWITKAQEAERKDIEAGRRIRIEHGPDGEGRDDGDGRGDDVRR